MPQSSSAEAFEQRQTTIGTRRPRPGRVGDFAVTRGARNPAPASAVPSASAASAASVTSAAFAAAATAAAETDLDLSSDIATATGVSGGADGAVVSANGRSSAFPILPLFLERRSSRAFSGDEVSRQQVATLLEAARWAPSSFNEQPWRFVVVFRGEPGWSQFTAWLSDANRRWCTAAGALVLIVAKTGRSRRTPHAFDTGAAWAHLALQAAASGLVAHAVAGFAQERAERELRIPAAFHVVCMVAVGRPGPPESLPAPLRPREAASQRRPLAEIAFERYWNDPLSIAAWERRQTPAAKATGAAR